MKALTVLMIDDDNDDSDIFGEIIDEIDPSIRYVAKSSCKDALKYCKENLPAVPDCIFLDLNLPAVDGFKCLEQIKKIPYLQNTPVIIYSTSKNPEDIKTSQKMGAFSFLTKQGHLDGVKKQIEDILGRLR